MHGQNDNCHNLTGMLEKRESLCLSTDVKNTGPHFIHSESPGCQ